MIELVKRHKVLAVCVGLMVAWLCFGTLFRTSKASNIVAQNAQMMTVLYHEIEEQEKIFQLNLFGISKYDHKVEVKAGISGQVIENIAHEGERVSVHDSIIKIATPEYYIILSNAEDRLKNATDSYKAALKNDNTDIARLKSNMDNAVLALEKAKKYASYHMVRAPFTGMIEKINVKVGDYVTTAEPLVLMVNTDKIKITTAIPAKYINHFKQKDEASVVINHIKYDARISFISSLATPELRIFTAELDLLAPTSVVKEGMSADIYLNLPKSHAYYVPSSSLTIDKHGDLVVNILEEDSSDSESKKYKVKFVPIEILQQDQNGFWVKSISKDQATQLATKVKLVVRGQGFVKDGEQVLAKSE